MKKTLLLFAMMFSVSLFSISCEDSNVEDDVQSGVTPDSGYEDDLSYSPELVSVNPGFERGEFSINLNSDGRTIQSYFLYWDNGKEMKEVEVTSSSDNITEILEIAEGDYTFYIKALDSSDKLSAASDKVSVYIYGEEFQSTSSTRIISSLAFDNKQTCIITWGEIASGDIKTTVTYTPYLGEETIIEAGAEDLTSNLANAIDGDEVTITTTIRPFDNALDEFTLTSTAVISASNTYVNVSSLEDLMPYLALSNQNIKLAPGVYNVTYDDVAAGTFNRTLTYTIDTSESTDSSDDEDDGVIDSDNLCSIIFVEGDNNFLDFSGVTINVQTLAFNAHGTGGEFRHIYTIGNNNVIKDLTLNDVGDKEDYANNGCTNIVLDGSYNRVEGINMYSTGSYPYGYGELFGKGSGYVIKHWKHCACLVRGDYNHVKNCTFIHHSYGHFIFMQGAKFPTIEGCYVEGEMGMTDDVLAEYGTGSAADLVNFMTDWDYTVPAGYTIPFGEDGIRTYKSGTTLVNGVMYSNRGTGSGDGGMVTVRDCVVKHARSGLSVRLGYGSRTTDNIQLIGCHSGFSTVKGGTITNGKADCAFGYAMTMAYDDDSNITADITLMPYEGEMYSGNNSKQAVYIRGSNHDITLRKGDGLVEDPELSICIGGNNNDIGSQAQDDDDPATGCTIVNYTNYHMIIDDNASNNTITTVGTYEDNGTNNTVNQ